ncbi:MAG: hypothetical protein M1429_02200 [Patescibacteria group bacterium]|nr:hypothetical protein [Patescibacteria group bacterium]
MKDSKELENNIVRLIAAVAFLVVAYFAIGVFSGVYTDKLTQNLSGPGEAMKEQLREQIVAQTDTYQATKLGIKFTQAQNDDLALLAFQKATDLDPTYRDGWVWRGYSELKNNQSQNAVASLKKAEEIDPINPRTYELLTIAYNQTNDTDNAKKTQEKYDYLLKSK